jgi:hypothetical protein
MLGVVIVTMLAMPAKAPTQRAIILKYRWRDWAGDR